MHPDPTPVDFFEAVLFRGQLYISVIHGKCVNQSNKIRFS